MDTAAAAIDADTAEFTTITTDGTVSSCTAAADTAAAAAGPAAAEDTAAAAAAMAAAAIGADTAEVREGGRGRLDVLREGAARTVYVQGYLLCMSYAARTHTTGC